MNTPIIKPGAQLQGRYSVLRFESRRLWALRRRGLARHGNPAAWRAVHGGEFCGREAQHLQLGAVTRALIDRDIARDIEEHPEAWRNSEIADVVEERPATCNLVLDACFDNFFTGAMGIGNITRYCAVGTGTGTPAVSDTGLGSEVARTDTMLTGSGNCGTSYASLAFTMRRTHDFDPVSSPQNFTELIWSHVSTAGANANIRVLISGGTVSLTTGQQLRTVHGLTANCSPTKTQSGTITVANWPMGTATSTAGTWAWQALGFSTVDTSGGNVNATTPLEPVGGEQWAVKVHGSCTLNTWRTDATLGTELASIQTGGAWSTYTPGSFSRSVQFGAIGASACVSTAIRAFSIARWRYYGDGAFGPTGSSPLVMRFNELQTKPDTHTLRIPGFTLTLSR